MVAEPNLVMQFKGKAQFTGEQFERLTASFRGRSVASGRSGRSTWLVSETTHGRQALEDQQLRRKQDQLERLDFRRP